MTIARRMRNAFGDPALVLLVLGLSLFGVAIIYSAGQLDVPNPVSGGAWRMQLWWLALSLVALLIVLRFQVRWLEWIAPPAYIAGIVLLALTLFIGTGAGTAAGTRSWIRFGPVGVQPAQFANLATILMLGRVMGRWREGPRSLIGLWQPITVVAIPMLLVMLQPDLGTAMVFGGVMLATLFWAGTPIGLMFMLISPLLGLLLSFRVGLFAVYMVALIAFLWFYRARLREAVIVVSANLAAGTIAIPLWNSLADYQRNRFLVFLDPYIDPRGAGYQHIQSRIAIGSGGLLGRGFTQGSQKRLAFLPEQHTDFIFAVVGEELGFLGAGALVFVYGLVLWRLARLAERAPDPFAGIVVFGIFGAWLTHILVNVGMNVGVMPITGIPLPFLSYGGSFLLASFIGLAIAERVASEQGRL
ncbi:MAG: rod shape-determining protein RodA [Gemmatimonadetes bacterium]|nr:rod shape-determining protein RodA [Gemmatimonadota bacterium]